MNSRIQFTPALVVALFCASGWFAFWLLAFQPATIHRESAPANPSFTQIRRNDPALQSLQNPTLFSLPSCEGFSGDFIESRIQIPLSLENPSKPIRYLPQNSSTKPGLDRTLLMTKTSLSQKPLPAPGAIARPTLRPAVETQLFLSPELLLRAQKPQIQLSGGGLPATVRVNLSVRQDGTVEQAFFETPVTNSALLGAIRQLRFKPSNRSTEGWIDIRFAREEGK